MKKIGLYWDMPSKSQTQYLHFLRTEQALLLILRQRIVFLAVLKFTDITNILTLSEEWIVIIMTVLIRIIAEADMVISFSAGLMIQASY